MELERRVQMLSERRDAVEKLDKKLVELVDQQLELDMPSSEPSLHDLKECLSSRTDKELEELDYRKQS